MRTGRWLLILSCAASAQLPSHQEPERSKATVLGAFVNQQGEPVGGVRVLSRIWPGAEFTSESGKDGEFETMLDWDAEHDGTWYEGYARKKGYALRKFRTDLRGGQEFDFGRLQLDPGGVLTGTVLGSSGDVLSGAILSVVNADEHSSPPIGKQADGPGWENVTDRGRTDDQGRFEIVGVPAGRWYVAAKHDSSWWHSSAPVELLAGESSEVNTLRLDLLPPEYRIEGVVLGPEDEPVDGAEVSTRVLFTSDGVLLESTAQTGRSGRFTLYLSRLPEDSVDLHVDPKSATLEEGSRTGVKAGARDLVIRLGATGELRVHVIDEHGLPVETFGWNLTVHKPDSVGMTGSPPRFHPGGFASLMVPKHPFSLEIRSNAHNQTEPCELLPTSLPEVLEIVLSSSAAISGDVSFMGSPVAGAFVELVQRTPSDLQGVVDGHWNGLFYGLKSSTALTDAQGKFRIPNDFPHLTYYVRAWASGYSEGMSGPVQPMASDVRVDLTLGGTVEGTVRVPGGLPARGVDLEFYREEIGTNSIYTAVGKIFRTKTREDGTYRQSHLAPGTWLVRVLPSGTLMSDLGWSETKKQEESRPHVVHIESEKTIRCDVALGEEQICVLEGRLSIADQIREGYCKLVLEEPLALELDASAISDHGRFRLVARQPGNYRLVIRAGPGHYQHQVVTDLVELSAGTTTWERDLSPDLWLGQGIRLDRP